MEYSRIDTTVKHYIKSRNEVRIKVENAGSEEDIIHGFINEDVFNGVLKKVLETLALPNVEKCDVSRLSLVIKDFITKHWYEIEPDVDGGSCGGGYVLSFEDVSRGMEVSFPCQEAIKLVEQCAYIVRDLIKGYCQAHGDTVCQLCENEALIGGMVLTSPVEAEEGVNGLSRRMVLGTPVETREDLNECQAEQLEYGCTDTQCINDCSPTKTHQENFMATRDSLDHRTSKLNSTVCLQVDIPSDQVASEQEEKNNAELSETDEEGAHCVSLWNLNIFRLLVSDVAPDGDVQYFTCHVTDETVYILGDWVGKTVVVAVDLGCFAILSPGPFLGAGPRWWPKPKWQEQMALAQFNALAQAAKSEPYFDAFLTWTQASLSLSHLVRLNFF